MTFGGSVHCTIKDLVKQTSGQCVISAPQKKEMVVFLTSLNASARVLLKK